MDELHPDGLEAYAILGRFLEEDGWHPHPLPEKHAYTMRYQGRNADLRCYAFVRVDAQQLVIYAIAPVRVPEDRRSAVAEFTTRANYGMYIGNFELDLRDGEVRYKCSFDFEGIALPVAMVRNTIYPAVQLLDRYMPGLMKVAFGGATAEEAIAEIEQ